jgi:hypothetical protein
MKIKSFFTIIPVLVALVVILTGCGFSRNADWETARPVTPSGGKGAISAQVDGVKDQWPGVEVISAYAAPFYGDESGKGIYVLDPSLHPQSKLDGNGVFQLNNLTPGRYVLVIGPRADSGLVVQDDQGKTWVVTVKPDEVLQLGVVKLAK